MRRSSCIYAGTIRHRRLKPVEHEFRYPIYLTYLDLNELDDVFAGRWLWSARRRAFSWLRREDHLGDPAQPLEAAVRALVKERTGREPRGPIRLLTHLRTFGHCFNPVSFFFCFAEDGKRVDTVVAEVNNTPWGERHCYVLPVEDSGNHRHSIRLRHSKQLHVSPFMGMQGSYSWRMTVPGNRLVIHNDYLETGGKSFDATLMLERREINGPTLATALIRFPLITLRVVARIHWQALRLWLKGAPFYSHPAHIAAQKRPR